MRRRLMAALLAAVAMCWLLATTTTTGQDLTTRLSQFLADLNAGAIGTTVSTSYLAKDGSGSGGGYGFASTPTTPLLYKFTTAQWGIVGTVGSYNGKTLSGQGLSYIIGTTGLLSAQGANISMANVPGAGSVSNGLYQVCGWAAVTQAATTSSTLPAINVIFNDGSVGFTTQLTPTATGNNTNTASQACLPIHAASATAVQYSTTSYASVGATSMQYEVYISVAAIF